MAYDIDLCRDRFNEAGDFRMSQAGRHLLQNLTLAGRQMQRRQLPNY